MQKELKIEQVLFNEIFKEGFLPAPYETKEAFFDRIAFVKEILSQPEKIEGFFHPNQQYEKMMPSVLVVVSNRKLPFWYGGMTWVLEPKEGIRFPIVQIRKNLLSSLKKEEILSHEKVHALRIMYNENKFEEILAFETSFSRIRKWISPLFSSAKETMFFTLSLFISFFSVVSPLFALPVCFLFASFFLRLFCRRRIFQKAMREGKKMSKNPCELLTLLTDAEIIDLARGKLKEDKTFRWQFICAVINKKH